MPMSTGGNEKLLKPLLTVITFCARPDCMLVPLMPRSAGSDVARVSACAGYKPE